VKARIRPLLDNTKCSYELWRACFGSSDEVAVAAKSGYVKTFI
jgi:hypothetical protein